MSRPGLLDTLRRLLGGGLEWTELRLALLANDIAFEKLRLLEALTWMAAALVTATAGLLLLAGLVLLLAADSWRLPALGLMALLCLLAAVWAWRQALNRLHGDEPPLAALRQELARDRAALGLARGAPEDASP